MATIKAHQFRPNQFGGATPYGNYTTLPFLILANELGALENSDSQDPLAADDVIVLGPLPEGMRLEDADVYVETAAAAGLTGSVGFRYTDGEDDEDVPEDPEYFLAAGDFATEGRIRAENTKAVILPKPAELIVTVGGAGNDQEARVQIIVRGELLGPV